MFNVEQCIGYLGFIEPKVEKSSTQKNTSKLSFIWVLRYESLHFLQ